MFGKAVVVAGDGAAADVDVGTNLGVAKVGEVVGLAALAEVGLFEFDEVADVGVFGQNTAGAQMGKGAQVAARPDVAVFGHGVRADVGASLDKDVFEDAALL